jgi:SsrA-binding protein
MGIKVLVTNRKAFHDFSIGESFEAGIALSGTEVKSLRDARANLGEGWVDLSNGEAILREVQISHYSHGNIHNHAEKRPRKLLLKKREIAKITQKVQEKGYTIVPIKIYFKDRWIKVEIAVAKAKKHFDKRDSEKEKQDNRSIARALKHRQR